MVSSERSGTDLSDATLLETKKIFLHLKKTNFFICKNEKNYDFFLEILPKFSDFANSDDYIGKITSKSI